MGLLRDIDLALHLPLRYEDETQVRPIGSVRDGETAQVEGVVAIPDDDPAARRGDHDAVGEGVPTEGVVGGHIGPGGHLSSGGLGAAGTATPQAT